MAFLVEEKELQGRKGFVITGYEGNARVLRIPEYLENASGEKLPVVEIAAHAFDGRGDLERVELPKSIRTLRAFSFFNCKNLREFLLWDTVEDYYDGSLRQCLCLSHIFVYFEKDGNFQIVRDILADSDRRLQFQLHLKGAEELSLLFPGYVDRVREDTMARQIHDTIDGCGYSYRQTVGRARIDLRLYDKLFERVIHDAKGAAVYIALGRLRYPLELLDKAKEDYLHFLREEDSFALRLLLLDCETEWVEFYMSLRLFSEAGVKTALELLAQYGNAELTARFLDYQERYLKKEREKVFFDPDSL